MDLEYLGDSTCIQSAGWESGYLTIEFQDGSIYTYEDVPVGSWIALKRATSKGWHFNKYIRNSYSFYEGNPPDSTYSGAKIVSGIMSDTAEAFLDEADIP